VSSRMNTLATNTDSHLLQVENLHVSFRLDEGQVFDAVKGVSFAVPENTTVALVGESGSGKSVSALAITGLLPRENAIVDPRSRALYRGADLLRLPREALARIRGKEISMIFQEPMSSLNPVVRAGEQIAEVLRLHLKLTKAQAADRVRALLEEVGIPEPSRRARAYPHELSGGQQQRVMIAMAIACEPKLLIADEPTTALDVTIQKQILELLAKIKQRHRMSMLLITHDLGVVAEVADQVVVLRDGEVKETGAIADIFARPRHDYTRALLACRPRLDRDAARLPTIEDFMGDRGEKRATAKKTPPSDDIVLEARNLSKDFAIPDGLFRRRPFHAVKNVCFALRRGRTLGLVGESGSGKSTLGLTLMRLHEATAGEVLFDGTDILRLQYDAFMPYKRRIQIVFQNPFASLNPRFTVGHILTEPMLIHGIGANSKERAERALALLDKVGLTRASFNKYPHEFSGGQRQRIAIARCLTLQPEVLICDEAVSALDVSIQAQVLNLLRDLQDEFGMSYIFISHDLAVVKHMSDDVLVMREGEVVESAPAAEIYRHPQHAYTRQLLSAIPRIA
jgi:peptide/nickel transport system ATP-binding protein